MRAFCDDCRMSKTGERPHSRRALAFVGPFLSGVNPFPAYPLSLRRNICTITQLSSPFKTATQPSSSQDSILRRRFFAGRLPYSCIPAESTITIPQVRVFAEAFDSAPEVISSPVFEAKAEVAQGETAKSVVPKAPEGLRVREILRIQEDEEEAIVSDDPPLRTRPRRIAFFVEPSPFNYVCGLTSRFCNTITQLRKAGDEVLVICPEAPGAAVVTDFHGARVHQIPGFVFYFYQQQGYRLSSGLRWSVFSELKQFKPDVIHVATPGVMVWGGILYSKLLGLPLVLSYHTHIPKYIPEYTFPWLVRPMWGFIKLWHGLASRTLVTSDVMKGELASEKIPRVQLWDKGIDTDAFHPRFKSWEMRCRLAGGEPHAHKPLLVYVGRLGAEKNVDHLHHIMEHIQTPDVRLGFVGDGPHRDAIKKVFADSPATFVGILRGAPLAAAFASGDVVVMPSESETLGFVVLEAMACGAAVVAVRAGGIPDLIADGRTGAMYTPKDFKGAAQLIDDLLGDQGRREALGLAGRAEAERWGWDATTRKLQKMYDEVHLEHATHL